MHIYELEFKMTLLAYVHIIANTCLIVIASESETYKPNVVNNVIFSSTILLLA